MRERLVAAFVGLTIVVVALYGVPRAYILADLVRDREQGGIERTAQLVAAAVGERREAGGTVDTAYLDGLAADGEAIKLRLDGVTVGTSGWTEPSGADLSTVVGVAGGGAVTVARDGERVDDAVADALLPVVVLGLLLAALAGLVGYLLARRIARPFQELAAAARGLGTGRLDVVLPAYRVPEARSIASALETSGRKLADLLRHERELTVHASHELRTPVTALRLELEDLALQEQTPPEVAAQLERSIGELDRLQRAIGDLLASSQDVSAAEEIDLDLDALVGDCVARLARSASLVAHTPSGPLPTRLDPVPVVAALDLLLPLGDRVSTTDRGTHLEVSIAGVGAGRTPPPEAADLVAAAGGQLAATPGGVVLRLPRRPLAGR